MRGVFFNCVLLAFFVTFYEYQNINMVIHHDFDSSSSTLVLVESGVFSTHFVIRLPLCIDIWALMDSNTNQYFRIIDKLFLRERAPKLKHRVNFLHEEIFIEIDV